MSGKNVWMVAATLSIGTILFANNAMSQTSAFAVSCNPSLSYVKQAQIGVDMQQQAGTRVNCNRVVIVQRANSSVVIQFQAADPRSPAYSFTGTRSPQPNRGRQAEYILNDIYLSTASSRAEKIPGTTEGMCAITSDAIIECVAKADFQNQRTVYRLNARIN